MGSPTKVPFVADLFKSLVLLTNQGQTRALYKLVCGGFGEIARPAGHNQAESYQSSILEAQEGNRGSIFEGELSASSAVESLGLIHSLVD